MRHSARVLCFITRPLGLLPILALASGAEAVIIKGDANDPDCAAVVNCPYTFDDNAFVDSVIAEGDVVGDPANVTDADLSTAVNLNDVPPDTFIITTFVDNVAVNGPGTDIVIFEQGGLTAIGVQIELDGVTRTNLFGQRIGTVDGEERVNAIELDLTDFGFAPEELAAQLLIFRSLGGLPQIADVAALNSIPEPSTALLVVAGLLAIGARRRGAR